MTLYTHPEWSPGTPGCHALIIAAGAYADAQDPTSPKCVPALPGVAASALDLADYLVANAASLFRPLATIELLVSQQDGTPVTWQGLTLDPPSMANIKAIRSAWLARVTRGDDQMAFSYFSGHGAYQGGAQFLTDDYSPSSPVDECIIRLDSYQIGMSTQRVPFQLFVHDCCQNLPDALQSLLTPVGGTPLVAPDCNGVRSDVEQIRVDAVSPGLEALTGDSSWLTAALLEAFANDAAERRGNDWWITPGQLAQVLNRVGRDRFGANWPTAVVSQGQARFDRLVKLLQPPEVAVVLSTRPAHAVPDAMLEIIRHGGNGPISDVDDNPCNWDRINKPAVTARIPGGFYVARASFGGQPGYNDAEHLFFATPRETREEIDCQ